MRIAIATEAGQVAAHFGRCPLYTLATRRFAKFEQTKDQNRPP